MLPLTDDLRVLDLVASLDGPDLVLLAATSVGSVATVRLSTADMDAPPRVAVGEERPSAALCLLPDAAAPDGARVGTTAGFWGAERRHAGGVNAVAEAAGAVVSVGDDGAIVVNG